MLKKMKEFNLQMWIIKRKANYYTLMADRAVRRYRRFIDQ